MLQIYLAGVLILLRQPFRIGDQVVFKGFEGTVEDIQTRSTRLKTYDGRRVVIPNGELYTSSVVVNTAYETRRSQVDVGVGYGDDVREASRLIRETVGRVQGVMPNPAPQTVVSEFAGSSVTIRAYWWTDPRQAELLRVQDEVLIAIRERLGTAGIDLPFPTRVVLFHDQTDANDGDRTRQREGWPAGQDPPAPQRIVDAISEERDRPVPRDGG